MGEWTGTEMKGILAVLYKWRRSIIGFVFTATIITSIVCIFLPKQYLSTAVVFPVNSSLADRGRIFNSNIQQLYSQYGGSDDLDHLFAIASSHAVLSFIADSFQLATHYKIEEEPARAKEIAIRKLKKNSEIIKTENGELRVGIWDKDKAMAADIANAILYKVESISRDIMLQSNMSTLNALRKGQSPHHPDSLSSNPPGSSLSTTDLSFAKEIREIEISMEAAPPIFITLEKASPSFEPGKPGIWLIITTVFLLSILFSIIVALVAERSKS